MAIGATKSPIVILESKGSLSELGLNVSGKIKNTSGKYYESVSLKLSLYDSNGRFVKSGGRKLYRMAPGETWLFKVGMIRFCDGKEGRKFLVEVTPDNIFGGSQRLVVTEQKVETGWNGAHVTITGDVKNVSGSFISDAAVWVKFYNKKKEVMLSHCDRVQGIIANGTKSFSVVALVPGVDSYTIVTD